MSEPREEALKELLREWLEAGDCLNYAGLELIGRTLEIVKGSLKDSNREWVTLMEKEYRAFKEKK